MPKGPFGIPVRALKLPEYMCRGLDDSDFEKPPDVLDSLSAIRIATGRGVWAYDRLGLRKFDAPRHESDEE